jgi:undecaprenyl-diphosphatase
MILTFDNAFLQWIQLHLRCTLLDWLMPYITIVGNGGWLWIVVSVVFLIRKKTRAVGVGLLISLVLSSFLGNLILKPWVGRIRPFEAEGIMELLIPPPGGFSFPSGHAISSFGVATTLWRNNSKMGRWAFLMASLIAFSRLYLYVHYPTDVLAGLFLGFFCGQAGFCMQNWMYRRLR